MKTTKRRKSNLFGAYYGKGGSHQHVYWQSSDADRVRKLYKGGRRKASDSLIGSYRCRQLGWASQKGDTLGDQIGEYVCFPLIYPKLETEEKLRKTGRYCHRGCDLNQSLPLLVTEDSGCSVFKYVCPLSVCLSSLSSFTYSHHMDLESVLQNEVRQKEENKYRLLTHECGIQKKGTDKPIFRAGIEAQTQRTNMWTWGGWRGGRDKLGEWH